MPPADTAACFGPLGLSRRARERDLLTTDSVQARFAPLVLVAGRTKKLFARSELALRARAHCASNLQVGHDLQLGCTSSIPIVGKINLHAEDGVAASRIARDAHTRGPLGGSAPSALHLR